MLIMTQEAPIVEATATLTSEHTYKQYHIYIAI